MPVKRSLSRGCLVFCFYSLPILSHFSGHNFHKKAEAKAKAEPQPQPLLSSLAFIQFTLVKIYSKFCGSTVTTIRKLNDSNPSVECRHSSLIRVLFNLNAIDQGTLNIYFTRCAGSSCMPNSLTDGSSKSVTLNPFSRKV